tara:strand:- start:8366 stop:8719 length:354 start_codon:yes stop_codon:yes gene_type:complete
MTRTQHRSTYASKADRAFRHGVDHDLTGQQFSDALTWAETLQLTHWMEQHGDQVHGRWFQFGGRFYFPDLDTAEAFRQKFGGRRWSLADLTTQQMLTKVVREKARNDQDESGPVSAA